MPVCISLEKRSCLVVGGGNIALRKIEKLLDYKSNITVITPEPLEKIEYFSNKNLLNLVKRKYISPEASSYNIVISAADDNQTNEEVYRDCRHSGTIVNVVDNPPLCDFIFPAVVRRGFLTASISTDGKAPFLSGHLRIILENVFPEHWKKIVTYASDFRLMVQEKWKDNKEKKIVSFDRFLNTDWKNLIKELETEEKIAEKLNRLME